MRTWQMIYAYAGIRSDFATRRKSALWKSKHIILGAKDAAEKRYLVIGTSTMNLGPRLSPIAGREFGF